MSVTVTAKLQDPSSSALQGNSFVRFRLRNFAGFVPRVLNAGGSAVLVQKTSGIIAVGSSGGTVSFASPTTAGNAVVIAVAWPDIVAEVLGSTNITDNGSGGSNLYADTNIDALAYTDAVGFTRGSQCILRNAVNPSNFTMLARSMQTVTFSGWHTTQPLSVWMYEIGLLVPGTTANTDQEGTTGQGGGAPPSCPGNPDFGRFPTTNPLAPACTSTGFNPSVSNFYVAVVAVGDKTGGRSISAVAAPWTLDTVQNGLGAAYLVASSANTQQASFTNGSSVQYCSAYNMIQTSQTPSPIVIAETQIDAFPDANGNISRAIWGNVDIIPAGTFYTVEFWDQGRITSSRNYTINANMSLNT